MAKRIIYLHIGQHKTGTTQIQLTLGRAHNMTILKENNFEYPMPSQHSAHEYLHKFLVEGREVESGNSEACEMVQRLINHIEQSNNNIIISAEGLQEVPPKKIKSLFSKFNVVAIAYIREQASYLFSAYQQEVKSGYQSGSFDDWFYGLGENIGGSHLNSWVASWEEAFGAENVILRRYQFSDLVDNDVVADFLTVVGLAQLIPTMVENKQSNNRIDVNTHMAMRIINSLGIPQQDILNGTYNTLEELSGRQYLPALGCDEFLVNEIRRISEWENMLLARRRFGTGLLFDYSSFPPEVDCSFIKVTALLFWIGIRSLRDNPYFSFKMFLGLFRSVISLHYFSLFRRSAVHGIQSKFQIRERAYREMRAENEKYKAAIESRDDYIRHLENHIKELELGSKLLKKKNIG